jgi:glycosyltransferase involved in cell wall biosynthesis
MTEFERLLRTFQPDIVHFHHALLIGVEAFQLVRRTLPHAAIALTLHDYYPICANDGQMVTTGDRRLCRTPSADACSRCFPEITRDRFVMRELFVKQAFSLIDRFVSPSEFLKRRYVDWGLPEERIQVIRNGLRDIPVAPHRPLPPGGRRNRFAFFGHLNPFKGALVAINAVRRVVEQGGGPVSLALHGASDYQTDAFKAELAKALDGASYIVAGGRYGRDEMPMYMADADWVVVPSIWWENAPLVIQEAFQHRRPVICSGIGGMAESVRDGVDGLWFRPGDSAHLAEKMTAALDPELWSQMAGNIQSPRSMTEAAEDHLTLYQELAAKSRSAVVMAQIESFTRLPKRRGKGRAATTVAPPEPAPPLVPA